MDNSEIHIKAGFLVDSYVVKCLFDRSKKDGEWECSDCHDDGWNATINGSKYHVKTSCAMQKHVLFEFAGRDGVPGWLFGDADYGVQACGKDRVIVFPIAKARKYIDHRFGPPIDVEPKRPQYTKVSNKWVSRLDKDGEPVGDAFIYIHSHDLINDGIARFEHIPMLDSIIGLCKTARNVQQSDDVRLAAIERLERFTA